MSPKSCGLANLSRPTVHRTCRSGVLSSTLVTISTSLPSGSASRTFAPTWQLFRKLNRNSVPRFCSELPAIDFPCFNLLFNWSFNFCLQNPTGSHSENLQSHRLSDHSSLYAGLYVFGSSAFGALDGNPDRWSLFYLLLVSGRVVSGRCPSSGYCASFPRLQGMVHKIRHSRDNHLRNLRRSHRLGESPPVAP